MKMNLTRSLVLLLSSALIFSSCQKEAGFTEDLDNGGGNNGPITTDITGNWKFIGMDAASTTSVGITESGQSFSSETFADYVTQDNAGKMQVTSNQFILTGITYSINDEMTSKTYINGVLLDESSQPFVVNTPPTDNTNDYVRNNNDSVTFTQSIGMIPDPSGGAVAAPTGAKVNVTGNLLTLTIKLNTTSNISQGGIPATVGVKLDAVMKFERQ